MQQIQSSHLNFKLELSPFCANISLKKSFIRNKAGMPLLPRSSEFNHSGENAQAEASVAENYEVKIKLLEEEINQLKSDKVTLTLKYEEEVNQSESLANKLDDTFERLDNLQKNFSNLESKHIKTCSDYKTFRDDYDDLAKEVNQSKLVIKTLRKESKELSSEHLKVVKKKDLELENLARFKILKNSEEREFKTKEKKLARKLKQAEERERKLNVLKSDLNDNEVEAVTPKTESGYGNVDMNFFVKPPISQCQCPYSITMLSHIHQTTATSTTFPSTVSHFLPLLHNGLPVSCTFDPSNMDQASYSFDSTNRDQTVCTMDTTRVDQASSTSSDSDDEDEHSLYQKEFSRLLEAFMDRAGKKMDNLSEKFLNST